MFAVVRKFTPVRGSAAEVARRVQDSFVPLLRDLPGFKEYLLFEGGPVVLIIDAHALADQVSRRLPRP